MVMRMVVMVMMMRVMMTMIFQNNRNKCCARLLT